MMRPSTVASFMSGSTLIPEPLTSSLSTNLSTTRRLSRINTVSRYGQHYKKSSIRFRVVTIWFAQEISTAPLLITRPGWVVRHFSGKDNRLWGHNTLTMKDCSKSCVRMALLPSTPGTSQEQLSIMADMHLGLIIFFLGRLHVMVVPKLCCIWRMPTLFHTTNHIIYQYTVLCLPSTCRIKHSIPRQPAHMHNALVADKRAYRRLPTGNSSDSKWWMHCNWTTRHFQLTKLSLEFITQYHMSFTSFFRVHIPI